MNFNDEREEVDVGRKILRSIDNRMLKLTVLPTERCNFRCTYCYEDFARSRMPRGLVEGLKSLMTARAPELKVLDIRWFGGEPLLALDIVREVSGRGIELARSVPGLQFLSGITTNAYLLTRPVFESLLEVGVRSFQISLDGYGSDHDATRRRADGAGTFEKIWQNLLDMRGVQGVFYVMLRVHFMPSTFDNVKRLVQAINAEFGSDSRFRIFFKAIARLGGPNNDMIERSPPDWQKRAKAELTRLVARGEEGTTDPTASAYVCYAAEPNSLVIRSDGALARCTVAFDDPRNNVGRLNDDGTLDIDPELSRLWFAGLENRDRRSLYCPLPTLAPAPARHSEIRFSVERLRETLHRRPALG